jgi:hypothetical protein
MEAKHTATPWKWTTGEGTKTAGGRIESDTSAFGLETHIADMVTVNQNLKADAEFIVRACNMHEELVTALKNAGQELLALDNGKRPSVSARIEEVRRALAKINSTPSNDLPWRLT